ncbi:glycosyl transferase family protein [[Clostridium] sordellii]|uniref:glycosyltransferase family 2 protein n=1 Tax=Paraclostridium sordellii TaxID=1505 RepID=UPI0005E91497|nr:glycosyltransferase family 2 protein [Paeniclostridium sordellii]MBX9179393.1 glycosyltransferase family 2 protein [Paeniclostridium sordellii]CEO12725.1 glycosyl transferase family protein [[Clostridium] sordellii] [Paeniclostridium sordellii]CEP83435.1 glycosyl transferase family protein [[Clostridium] sordellii] [Paeniclostridium sordellii]
MNKLSVCMIVRNEEKNIERCLISIKDIADEIIIVDTGSTDKTTEICKKFNVKLINHKWNDDFSEARNISLDYATKDYILFLDADEEISKEDRTKLKALLNKDSLEEGYFLKLSNVIKGNEVGDYTVFRLFKNNPKYRFKGKIHEQVATTIQELNGKKCIGTLNIKIIHYGYDPNTTNIESKYKRNINILNNYKEEEKDTYYYYVLGNEYSRIEDFKDSIISYEKAIKSMNKKYNYFFYPYLVLNLAKSYFNTNQFFKEIKFIEHIKKTTPDFKDLYFMECLANIECGKITKALNSLDDYIKCPKSDVFEYPDNKFENIYDIDSLKSKLKKSCINNEDCSLSGLMIIEEYDNSLIDTIKSFNEILVNFVVVTSNMDLNLDPLKNIGAQIIFSKNKNKNFTLALKECRGKYIYIANKGELCSILSQGQIVELIKKSDKESFSFNIISVENKTYQKEVKLIKKKNIQFLEMYIQELIKKGSVVDSNIYIHKIKV